MVAWLKGVEMCPRLLLNRSDNCAMMFKRNIMEKGDLHQKAVPERTKMKKLLLLGTSLASVEIVETAKEMGCYTIVTDNLDPDHSSAKKVADEYWMISTDELDLLEKKCRDERVNVVFAGISEFNLDRVKELTDRLGLPCYIENAAWKYARDKSAFKGKCREIGIPVVYEYTVSDSPLPEELSVIEYPVVVKPVDGAGNKGLSICKNEEELIAGCRKARKDSDSGNILIERYITGEESWHYYFLAEDEIRHTIGACAFRQPGYPTFLYVFCVSAVADIKDYKEQVDQKCAALLKEIGCRRGSAWFQFIKDNQGKFYALEMAQRMSAGCSGKAIKKAIGVNSIEWMLDIALGREHTADMIPEPSEPPYKSVECVYYQFADRDGTIASMEGYGDLDPERFQVSFVVHEGDTVPRYRLMVRIVFNASSPGEMCEMVQYINDNTCILDENNENMYVRFTDFDEVRGRLGGLFCQE